MPFSDIFWILVNFGIVKWQPWLYIKQKLTWFSAPWVVVVVVVRKNLRGMEMWRNSTEAQQSGHAPRSGPEIQDEELATKMAHWRSWDAWPLRRRWAKSSSCIAQISVQGLTWFANPVVNYKLCEVIHNLLYFCNFAFTILVSEITKFVAIFL